MSGSKSKGKHYEAWANEGCFVEAQYLSKDSLTPIGQVAGFWSSGPGRWTMGQT